MKKKPLSSSVNISSRGSMFHIVSIHDARILSTVKIKNIERARTLLDAFKFGDMVTTADLAQRLGYASSCSIYWLPQVLLGYSVRTSTLRYWGRKDTICAFKKATIKWWST